MQNQISPKLISHGKILDRPTRQPLHTENSVAYELGKSFQLDKDTCLLVASMDEQGGGDLCVGNDAFIFQSLDDISADKAIPLNSPDPEYPLKNSDQKAFLAKFPVTGGFVPLGAKLPNGNPHPGAGTGLFVSLGLTFNQDRTSAGPDSEVILQAMQVQWDGQNFKVNQASYVETFLDKSVTGVPLSYFLIDGEHLLSPFATPEGIVVFRFQFDGEQWKPVAAGEPFITNRPESTAVAGLIGENEPSIQKVKDRYYVYTRGYDPVGRLYTSTDGLNYQLCTQRYNNMVPQSLNKALDGSLYIATNPNMGWLRNPLAIYPLVEQSFTTDNFTGAPMIIHDQDGIRGDGGESIPFVDHGVGCNLFLQGKWHHLFWYRVSDLKSRSAYDCQAELKELLGTPNSRFSFEGLYVSELLTDSCTELPFQF